MISLEIAGSIAELCLSRAPVNALDGAMLDALEAALARIAASDAHVVLLHSDRQVFCAGADLAMIRALFDAPDPHSAMSAYVAQLHRVFDTLENLPAVTIAALSGATLGGGLELALACDLRIAAQEATLGLPEAAVGLLPGAGGTQRLTRLCGPGVAHRLILGAERISGTEAHRVGLAQFVAPRASVLEEARAIATRIAGLAPASLRASKTCIRAATLPEREGFAVEQRAIAGLMGEADTRARVNAFFSRQTS